jgi:hypothetical protein
MGDIKIEVKKISVRMKKGEKFTTEMFIQQCGFKIMMPEDNNGNSNGNHERNIYRTTVGLLNIFAIQGFIKTVDTEKHRSKGRPPLVYECIEDLEFKVSNFYKDVKEAKQ